MPLARTIRVLVKLLPVILVLRRDRKKWSRQQDRKVNYAKNARRALDAFVSLGPVYIKLGQWLSARADILPQPYMVELAKLQDDVPAVPFEQVKPVLEKELGPINDIFESINTTAISGASLGQVYRARLSGQDVVIKIRRPGIEKVVSEDIAVLKKVLPAALSFVDPNLRFSARAMLAQFIESIGEEMDYVQEADNLRTIKENLKDHGNVRVPQIYGDYSTKSVLVLEYMPGVKITDVKSLNDMSIDRKSLIIEIHRIFFTMLLRHSVFHADPHPGNISVDHNGRIILYDFGMVGRLDRITRIRLIRLYLALVDRDPSRTIDAMDELGMLAPGYNRPVMEKAMRLTIEAMHGRKPDEMEVKGLMELANRTMSRFPFLLPKNLALYMRMASIIEGIYKTHKVDFRFVTVLRDILQQENLAWDGYVEEAKRRLGRIITSLDTAATLAPDIKEFLNAYHMPRKQNRIIAGAIFSSAIFLGSALVYAVGQPEGIMGMILSLVVMGLFARSRG